MKDFIRIPERRIGVLIGNGGSLKRQIEEKTRTRLFVDDSIEIEGEAVDVMTVKSVVKAIGRGFSPESAMKLLDEENTLYTIDLPSDRNSLSRVKSRLIGTRGKARKNIERMTNTRISIYGKTVCIIGSHDNVESARVAIERLVGGSPHKNVYRLISR
jgi:ribosomal RNA assembly protein